MTSRRLTTITGRSATLLALFAGVSLHARGARADEPLKPTEPTLMSEPGEVVDVVDAFDTEKGDPFDLNLSLGFHQSWERGKIRRESYIGPDDQTSTGGFVSNIENIANYKHTVSTLNMRADVGLYKDLALFFRVPLILADDRSLSELDGSGKPVNAAFGRVADPATGDPMFKVPFNSPTRSGVDYIAAGLRWSVFNHTRDLTKPTWTWEVEGRFGVGEPLHACNANPEKIPDAAYAAAGSSTRGGTYPECPGLTSDPDQAPLNGADGRWYRNPNLAGRKPGISRGTNAIRVGTLFSNRFRYVEPYGGFWFMAEWQKSGTDIGNYGDIEGIITNRPPLRGGLAGGLMLHPWENREQYQRFTIDLRFDAQYVSQGRDYTPLFDALGSSNATSLVAPNPAEYRTGDIDPATGQPKSVGNYRKPFAFTGVTDVEAHGIFGGHVGFIVQAAQYIRFNIGGGVSYVQSHLVSASDACNPDFTPSQGAAGRCRTGGTGNVTGAPNPNHRPVIDLPGRRFRVAETFIWDAWVSGTVMF
ncbi:MAG: hypothetical protein HYV09_17545 [Deltaproteobacteria bacterium]|nr:hypothetical protein [Deltaproteobacteria bacterium]